MSTSAIVGVIIIVVAVAIVAAAAARILIQRRELRERYGDEYDRVVTEKGGRAAAEAELRRRERRHAQLELHELSPEVRESYRSAWTDLQGQFIDDPNDAVHAADLLVSRLVAERGYPVVDYSDRLAHLSVEHAAVLTQYREAHDISVRNASGTASTEELRRALVDYRGLIADLLGDESLRDGAAAAPLETMAEPVDAEPVDVHPVDSLPVDARPIDAQPVAASTDGD